MIGGDGPNSDDKNDIVNGLITQVPVPPAPVVSPAPGVKPEPQPQSNPNPNPPSPRVYEYRDASGQAYYHELPLTRPCESLAELANRYTDKDLGSCRYPGGPTFYQDLEDLCEGYGLRPAPGDPRWSLSLSQGAWRADPGPDPGPDSNSFWRRAEVRDRDPHTLVLPVGVGRLREAADTSASASGKFSSSSRSLTTAAGPSLGDPDGSGEPEAEAEADYLTETELLKHYQMVLRLTETEKVEAEAEAEAEAEVKNVLRVLEELQEGAHAQLRLRLRR